MRAKMLAEGIGPFFFVTSYLNECSSIYFANSVFDSFLALRTDFNRVSNSFISILLFKSVSKIMKI
jgi:hypothetical protein